MKKYVKEKKRSGKFSIKKKERIKNSNNNEKEETEI